MSSSSNPDEINSPSQDRRKRDPAEDRFRNFAEFASDWMWEMDADIRFTWVSHGVKASTGLQDNDYLGKTIEEIGTPKGGENVWVRFVADLRAHIPVKEFSYWRNKSDGERRCLAVRAKPIFETDGEFVGYLGIVRDITEQRNVEQALQDSEEKYKNLIDGSHQGVAVANRDRELLFCNQSMADIFGYASPAEVLALSSSFELVAPSEYARLGEQRDLHFEGLTASPFLEFIGRRKDGRSVEIEAHQRVLNWEGQPAIQYAMIDISERKRAEKALRESEERFRAIIDNGPTGVIFTGLDGRIQLSNKRYDDWYGYKTDERIGRTAFAFLPQSEAESITAIERRVVSENISIEREQVRVFADGKQHTIVSVKFPVHDGDGNAIGVGTVQTDVTEERRVEEQLRQALKMEVVGQLTGGIAHDFNNLLTVIQGNIELAAERLGGDNDVQVLLDRAAKASIRGGVLTHRLLAFSRRQTLMPAAIDVSKLINDIIDLIRRTLGANIEIDVVSNDDTWRCHVDSSQLENAILNLSINARDAMPNGGTLTIAARNLIVGENTSTGPELTPGNYVSIALGDTGSGMPRETIAKAFEPFYTTKEIGQGSGLGLSMVYGFIKQSGGDVVIDSVVGIGTTVTMYLPKSVEMEDDAQPSEEEAEPRARGEKVLVVEDDPDVRALTVNILGELGYETVDVNDGDAAISALNSNSEFNLLLIDVMLPGGIGGGEVAEQANKLFPDMAVLFMSGFAAGAIKESSLAVKSAFLDKPFRKIDLAQKLRFLLNVSRG